VLDLVLKRWMPLTHPTVPGAILRTVVALVVSVVAAMVVHHGVELRAQRLLTRRRARAQAAPAAYPDGPRSAELAGVTS
jgi:peptidoglycan/LPS O-acetylase OafA/YrhL